MMKRAWFAASVIAALAALVVGTLLHPGSAVTGQVGALLIVIGLMPVALLAAGTPDRRRRVAALHVAAGALFTVAGLALTSQDGFLGLRLASIDWRILAGSGPSLIPVGWMAIGVALTVTGTGLLRSRRSWAVLSALLMVLTCGYFAASLAVVPYLYLRRHGVSLVDPQAIAAAIVLLLAAVLLVIAALSRLAVTWVPTTSDGSGRPHASDAASAHPDEILTSPVTRRRVKAAIWSAVGVATLVTISIVVWLGSGPRVTLADAFPDTNLATCVAHQMGKPGPSAKVSQSELGQVRSLSCNGDLVTAHGAPDHLDRTRIQSIGGLDALPNLASLGLPNNRIRDLTPLAGLKKLGSVTLTHNQVTDLAPLAGLPVLSNLGLSGNAISDLTPLAHVRSLTSLGLAGNQISDLAPLADLTGLATLDGSENLVSDVTPLARLTHLGRLTLAGNRIVDPAPLGGLPALSVLNLSRNRIADAGTFTGFAELEELWLGGNLLTDVTPLAALPSLTGVDLEGADPGTTVGLDDLRARNIYVGRA
jgi:internalin A